MFINLKIEMMKRGVTVKDLSERIGISSKTYSNKMNGTSEFTRKEMYTIRDLFFPDKSIEYLFASDKRQSNG
jgi:transcriptional regulator with XRE-family HTH domain